VTRDLTEFMHAELARNAGIVLDAPINELAHHVVHEELELPVDRDLVRKILRAQGAPDDDLEWLTMSCPSLQDAEMYRPPPRYAWCIECNGVQPSDVNGCIPCMSSVE